jgi:hypothetical protein
MWRLFVHVTTASFSPGAYSSAKRQQEDPDRRLHWYCMRHAWHLLYRQYGPALCSHLSGFAAQYGVKVSVSSYAKNVSLRRAAPMDMVTQGALRSGALSYV